MTCSEMVTGDNVQHARSCGRGSMVHPSRHLHPVLMKTDRSHPHRLFVSHTFHILRLAFPPHMPGTFLFCGVCSKLIHMVAERDQRAANRKNTRKLRKHLHQFDNTCAANAHNTTK